jgi:hypothetical protein
MKRFSSILTLALMTAIMAVAFTAPARAATSNIFTKSLLTNQATSATSTAFNTGIFTKKTVVVSGMTAPGTFTNYSGTVAFNCGPTAAGPLVACKDKTGNAVTLTHTNGLFVLDDQTQFIQAVWTKTRAAATKNIGVWILYQSP